jgi:hypothetical protein
MAGICAADASPLFRRNATTHQYLPPNQKKEGLSARFKDAGPYWLCLENTAVGMRGQTMELERQATVPILTVAERRSLADRLYTLWLALVLVAVVAAGFGLSYFAFAQLASVGPAVSVETMGELWE